MVILELTFNQGKLLPWRRRGMNGKEGKENEQTLIA